MNVLLNDAQWQLTGCYPWVPVMGNSSETGSKLQNATGTFPATVPGGVHYDSYRAGLIEHPYQDRNSWKCEWVENRWWVYETTITKPTATGRCVQLVFKGLDYKAIVLLNGVRLGEHEGMYHPAVFDITAAYEASESLHIRVIFENVPDEMGQIGKTSLTKTQKSRFNYKWDFSARLVNIGIWDDVYIRIIGDCSIEDVNLTTDVEQGIGKISAAVSWRNWQPEGEALPNAAGLKLVLSDPEGIVIAEQVQPLCAANTEQHFAIDVARPQLWYPNGYGEQPLYSLSMRIIGEQGTIWDERTYDVGIRSLRYVHNEDSPTDALPYTFVINDRKIYVKGVNLVPLDHLYGNVTDAHYEWMIYLMKQANVNLIRVWGGGIIEKQIFYELCDRYGIMVWQEFVQSSSGVDNVPSKLPSFLKLLTTAAIAALKDRRNHVSLSVWSGGNELIDPDFKPLSYDDENIAMLNRLVERYDPTRMMLPTSPTGPVVGVTAEQGISHDVHGQWKYVGNPGHYALYGASDSLLHSEFGVDGMSSLTSLRRFFSERLLTPRSMEDDLDWRHHGEWWDTYSRSIDIFGTSGDIAQFVRASQWMQAEGLRYIIEANRRRKFRNSGSIIWQFNEPWPNASCTSIVDYYGEAKMAYYWARNAYAPLHVSLAYGKLDYSDGEAFAAEMYVHATDPTRHVEVKAEVFGENGTLILERTYSGAPSPDRALPIGELRFETAGFAAPIFIVRLTVASAEGEQGENVYFFSTNKTHPYASALQPGGVSLETQAVGDWHELQPGAPGGIRLLEREYRVANVGSGPALHIYPEETTLSYWMDANCSFFTLMPGEERTVKVRCATRQGGGFLTSDLLSGETSAGEPSVSFVHFTQSCSRYYQVREVAIG